ncbi:MAG: hypothetical protein P4L10_02855, partial [Acidobacteriaceae bacterium]|nr:hypothetical protein [Acidobacteriaceae bacterium]
MRLATLALAAALVSLPAAAQMSMPMDKPMAKPGMMEKKAAVPSTSLTLVIAGKTVTLTLAQLAALPHKSVTVRNIHSKLDETYSGVALADLLAANGAPFTKETQNKMLKSYIVATGTDG